MHQLKITALFGGTFDPIHYGHLNTILSVANDFNLSKVYLMPNNIPPHKTVPRTTVRQRLDMIKLAIHNQPLFDIERYELNKKQPSYTIETLKAWRQTHSNNESLVFIIGKDSLITLNHWQYWQDLLNYCHLIVCPRPGFSEAMYSLELQNWITQHLAYDKSLLKTTPYGYLFFADNPLSNISATTIRQHLASGKYSDHILPPAVLNYIKKHKLYK